MAIGTKQARQFQDLFNEVIPFKATADFASTVDGNEATVDITVTGAALGDLVLIAPGADIADLGLAAQVTAANVVTAQIWNNTGGTINPASQTLSGIVLKPSPDFDTR